MRVDPNSFFIDDIFKTIDKHGSKSKDRIKSSSKKKNKKVKEKSEDFKRDCFGRRLIPAKPVKIEMVL